MRALAANTPHGLALCGAAVLVLVRLVGDEQVERALEKLPLDELGRLVAAFAKAELHVGHRTFHPVGLPIREDQLAVAIHQVDELVDVVPEHRREEGVTELLHQLLRGDFANGWNTLQCLEHGRGLVAGGQASGTDQRPQRCTAVAALAAGLLGFEFDRVDRLAVEVGDDVAAIRARRHVAVRRAPPNEDRFPVEPHPHPHAAQDEELLALGRHAQLLAQFQQLDQGVRAIEHPDLGAGHRLLDFAPPLVDQVGWREH